MTVKDFIHDLIPFIKKEEDFCLSVLERDEDDHGHYILLELPLINRDIDLKDLAGLELKNPCLKRNVDILRCATGSCGWVDGTRCFEIDVTDEDKDICPIVDEFIQKYNDNPYFQNYVNTLKEYKENVLLEDDKTL